MTPDFSAAVTARSTGTLLDLEVTAGAPEDRFPAGFNPWRRRIGLRVRAPAVDGRANRAACALVAAHLGVSADAVTLAAGQTSPLKTLHIAGVTAVALLARLSEAAV